MSTPGALDLFGEDMIHTLLSRHASGDWGDLCDEDRESNDHAFEHEDGRIFSSYVIRGDKLWIITEHNRTVTTCLLPDEY